MTATSPRVRAPHRRLPARLALAFGLGLLSTGAAALPLATTTTSCGTGFVANQSCVQHGLGGTTMVTTASLVDLTATARIDSGPFSYSAAAGLNYYVELTSGSGTFDPAGVPVVFRTQGVAEVGGLPGLLPGQFNNGLAEVIVSFDGQRWGACAGRACDGSPSSFGGDFALLLRGSGSGLGANVYQIVVEAFVDSNSNYPSSFVSAYADPSLQIDPAYALAHPEYGLVFSSNIPTSIASPVPEPGSWALLSAGLALFSGRRWAARKGRG
jgi:hypothetical protein